MKYHLEEQRKNNSEMIDQALVTNIREIKQYIDEYFKKN
jgi:hypothetical protein